MKKRTSVVFALVLLTSVAFEVQAQSPYFNAVSSLNPVVYLPLQETTQPPLGDVETNLGSLGALGDAVYSSVNAAKNFTPAATADGDVAVECNLNNGGFLAVPVGNPGVTLPAGPFTVEAWVYPMSYTREGIVAQTGGIGSGGVPGSSTAGDSAGWSLTENDIPSLNNSTVGWAFHVYNGNGAVGPTNGAEAYIITPYATNQWYYIVGVFDGTNCALYVNATNIDALASSAGTIVSHYTMTGSQALDTWDPLTIGCARGLNQNRFFGGIDEVAVYTHVLTPAQVQNHFTAASGSSYASAVEGDSPYMYWRMDSSGYAAPDPSTYPTAANFGSITPVTGNGTAPYYGPAAQPGVPGPAFTGFGPTSYAVAINGIGGNNGGTFNVNVGNNALIAEALPVDVGLDSSLVLNPTNIDSAGFSATIWFRCNPADAHRFQNFFGHTDSGWRAAIDGNGILHFKPGNNGTELHSAHQYNDGNWHQLVVTCNNTAENMYVDGMLSASSGGVTTAAGATLDVIVGGDSQYLSSGNETVAYGSSGRTGNTGYANRDFDGSVCHFAFFTNALTADQVQALYSAAGAPPVIVAQPVTGRVNPGSPSPDYLFFGVVASGASTLSYQWYFNTSSNYAGATALSDSANGGVKYAGSTSTQVTVSNLVDSDSGYYFVVITNAYGSVTSSLASLTIIDEPTIVAQSPSNSFSLYQGQSEELTVTATSEATNQLFYQWYTNGVAVPSGTNASYIAGPAPASLAVGTTFRCVVSNIYGAATNQSVSLLAVLPLPAKPPSLTSSPFGSSILALNPTAYWPMHEVEAPLAQRDIETNYGTIGQLADAYYGDWKINGGAPGNSVVMHQYPGALNDSSVFFTTQGGSYAVIPRTSPLTTIKAPFTIEGWVMPYNNNFGIMLSVGDLSGNHGLNGGPNQGGFDWLWAGSANTFSITVRSGNGTASTEPKTTASYYPGQWYHVVTTFDGTNVAYYINGVQDPLQNSAAATMAPNTWEPITIGGGRWTGGINNPFLGGIDNLAVYTNILTAADIQKHYNDGISSGDSAYRTDVLADSPILFYRMDSPPYVTPPLSQWPVLTNYGSVGVQGVYTPNAAPGAVPGPHNPAGNSFLGFGGDSALQGDGLSVFADAGFDPAFNPQGTTPFTVAAWVKGNPADISDRNWQSVVSHSDSGWRLNMNGNNGRANFNSGGSGGGDLGNNASTPNINDGNWHYVVGAYDGTNTDLYVDGQLGATQAGSTALGNTMVDVFLGGYPSGTFYGDTVTSVQHEINRMLAGNLCEVAFWNGVALSSNQVATLYGAAEIPPYFVRQPVSANVDGNTDFTNTVVAGGNGPFTYQWYRNGAPVPDSVNGSTNDSLIFNPVQPSDQSSDYYVVLANAYGSITSDIVSLTVNTNLSITQDISPTNVTLFAGGHTTFSIAVVGARPYGFQWYSNSVALAGETGSSYTLTNAQAPGTTYAVSCVVTNAYNTISSSAATVTVLPDPTAGYPLAVMADQPIGFWRLNEGPDNPPNNGVVAHDYWGGHDGLYSNVDLAQPGYNPATEPTETSMQVGLLQFNNCGVFGIPTNVDFGMANTASDFSVECWVTGLGLGQAETTDAGVVTKGYGGGGEQFNLDCGANSTNDVQPFSHNFRFFVRSASGTVYGVNSFVNAADGQWHHLVGVCDESAGYVALYADGVLIGTNGIPSNAGILSSSVPVSIGARASSSTVNANDQQFVGYIDDVAIYNYALSADQVVAHFVSAARPAAIIKEPTDAVAGEFGTATFSATVQGTPPLTNQWYDDTSGTPVAIAGATNTTLVLTNLQSTDNGRVFYLTTANAFGGDQSPNVTLTVISGTPKIFADVQNPFFAIEGGTGSDAVTAYGTEPLSYQWQFNTGGNWVNVTDGNGITGSQSNVLIIADAQPTEAGDYQCVIANNAGSVTSSVAQFIVGTLPVGFNINGAGWKGNQNGGSFSTAIVTNGLLTLTDNSGGETRSFWFNYPQYIGAFKASFTYRDTTGPGGADGVAFCLQNDARGPAALGGGGGSLGVSGIAPSAELELNLYTGNSQNVGYTFLTNGLTGSGGGNGNYRAPGSISIDSGNPIDITLNYDGQTLSMTMTDTVANASFGTNLFVGDLSKVVGGGTAYIGFTGADGGVSSTQIITNFAFVSIPTEAIQVTGPGTAVISWPGAILGYTLQANPNLGTSNWVNVTNADNIANGLHNVVVPVGASNEFYRLSLP